MKIYAVCALTSFAYSAFVSDPSMHPKSFYLHASTSSSSGSSKASGHSSSEVSFTARDSVHKVNGDTVEIKNGDLRVNGISYGKIDETSTVKYSVKGGEKILMVDGVVRRPER